MGMIAKYHSIFSDQYLHLYFCDFLSDSNSDDMSSTYILMFYILYFIFYDFAPRPACRFMLFVRLETIQYSSNIHDTALYTRNQEVEDQLIRTRRAVALRESSSRINIQRNQYDYQNTKILCKKNIYYIKRYAYVYMKQSLQSKLKVIRAEVPERQRY